jgi:hypothetical protein
MATLRHRELQVGVLIWLTFLQWLQRLRQEALRQKHANQAFAGHPIDTREPTVCAQMRLAWFPFR